MARLELKKRTLDEIGQRGRLISLIDPHPEGRGEELPAWIWMLIVLTSIGALLVLALFVAPVAEAQERRKACIEDEVCTGCFLETMEAYIDCFLETLNSKSCGAKVKPSFRDCVLLNREAEAWLRSELPQWAEP